MAVFRSFLIFAILALFGSTLSIETNDMIDHQDRLMQDLMKANTDIVPVSNGSAVDVKFGLALLEIIELDETREFLDVVIWMRKLWNDFRLQWNPADYGGISVIRLPNDKVWKPDIVSYTQPKNDWYFKSNVVVYSSGDVLFIPPGETRFKCAIDTTYFPRDETTCHGKFGSWTYDGFMVNLSHYDGLKEIDISDYREHDEFEIMGTKSVFTNKYYPCCKEPYPDITFSLTIKRKSSAMFSSLLVTPGLMIALLTPLLFILPSGKNHRFALGGALLVCCTVLMLIIGNKVPPSPSPPLLSEFFAAMFVIASFCMALSTLTSNLANRSMRLSPMPGALKKLTSCLARPCCINMDSSYWVVESSRTASATSGDKEAMVMEDQIREDWRILAVILDRLFFFIFLVINVIICLAILTQVIHL